MPAGRISFSSVNRFAGDGKIETDSLTDSTLSKVNSQNTTYFENGEIIHKSGALIRTASKLDDSLIEFAPKEKAANSFAWQKESADVWTARLNGKDA